MPENEEHMATRCAQTGLMVTKAMDGKPAGEYLAIMSSELMPSQTARQTNQLQPDPPPEMRWRSQGRIWCWLQ